MKDFCMSAEKLKSVAAQSEAVIFWRFHLLCWHHMPVKIDLYHS